MIAHIRRGAALTAMVAAVGALNVRPAAAEETTTTVAAAASRQGHYNAVGPGTWSVTEARDAPWPADSASNGSAYSGGHRSSGYSAWLVEFALPSRMTCKVVSAQVSIRPFDQIGASPIPPPDPPFEQANVFVSSGNGNPTASAFEAPVIDRRDVTPSSDAPLNLDFTDATERLVSEGSAFVDITVYNILNGGLTLWDAPWDQPATRPSLTVTCASIGPDDDHDGVANTDDICPRTVLPDKITALSKVKYAANSSGVFRAGSGATPGLSLDHTAGCSAIQIGQRLGPVVELDVRLWGLALNKLQKWADTH